MLIKTYFIREIHLINNLTIKIFINVNIIVLKKNDYKRQQTNDHD